MEDVFGVLVYVVISRLGGILRVYRPEGRGSINRNIPTRRDLTTFIVPFKNLLTKCEEAQGYAMLHILLHCNRERGYIRSEGLYLPIAFRYSHLDTRYSHLHTCYS